METIETSLITDIIFGIIMLILLVCSATFSGSETAYFALSPKQLENLREEGHNYCIKLIEQPERLLATILIANNFANVGIVTISSYLAARIFTFENQVVVFLLQVVLVTFLILLFGEILPKLFANRARLTIAKLTSKPMYGLMVLFSPFSSSECFFNLITPSITLSKSLNSGEFCKVFKNDHGFFIILNTEIVFRLSESLKPKFPLFIINFLSPKYFFK